MCFSVTHKSEHSALHTLQTGNYKQEISFNVTIKYRKNGQFHSNSEI